MFLAVLKLSDLTEYMDMSINMTSVIATVLGAVFLYVFVKRAISFSVSLVTGTVTGVLKAFPAAATTAALLFVVGIGGFGYGVGELTSGPSKVKDRTPTISNDDLAKIARDKEAPTANVQAVLEFVKQKQEQEQIHPPMPVAQDQPTTNDALRPQQVVSTAIPAVESTTTANNKVSTRLGWMAVLAGIGSAVVGAVIYLNSPRY